MRNSWIGNATETLGEHEENEENEPERSVRWRFVDRYKQCTF
jgi:hypothetical protein